MIKEKDFEFSYQGENSIDVNTLLTSQFHFVASLSAIQKELFPEVELKIKIAAFKEGSFVVQLMMETAWLQQMFTKENASVIAEILGAFVSITAIHKYLKGKKPDTIKENGDVVEIGRNGNLSPIIINKQVYNIYKHNTIVSSSIQKNFEVLDKDPQIEGIEIRPQGETKPILSIHQSEFAELAQPNPFLDKEQNEELHVNETVYIKKPNLMPEKNKVWNWELIHKGRDIKAKITDRSFESQINSGLRVAQGDRLVVDLKIFQKWHEQFSTFVESGRFEIMKVHQLIERPKQPPMFPDKPDSNQEG
jgi:hypothetical protein